MGFWIQSPGRRRAKRPQVAETAPGCRPCSYETASGRGFWLSRDPIEEQGGLNLYGMVGNDPISRVDPFGLWFEWLPIIGTIETAIRTHLSKYPGMKASDYPDPCAQRDHCFSRTQCVIEITKAQTRFATGFLVPNAVRAGIDIAIGILNARFGNIPATLLAGVDTAATIAVYGWGADKLKAAANEALKNCDKCKDP